MPAPAIRELGHVGIRCFDVQRQLDFYTRVLGLTLTDHDDELGIWFLSARPDVEHHELLLATGRTVARDARLIQQVSFRCAELDDVIGFLQRFRDEHTELDMVVSHGNAIGVYFFDPEGNRCEVYWQTGLQARQPFVQNIDLDQPTGDILAAVRDSVARFKDVGFAEGSYVRWTKRNALSADS